MKTAQLVYVILGSALAFASLLGLCWRYVVRPIARGIARFVDAVARIEAHSDAIAELKELFESTVVVVLDATDTLDRRMRTVESHLGIPPSMSLAQIVRDRRQPAAERRRATVDPPTERRTGERRAP